MYSKVSQLYIHIYFFSYSSSLWFTVAFPDSSVGKESVCNAGDPGLIPGSERSSGEGIGYPLQYYGLGKSMNRGSWKAKAHRVTVRQD